MKTRVIKIGNSQGIRSKGAPRAERPWWGWDGAFRSMAEHEDDRLLGEDLTGQTYWDEDEWQW
jgi:hypothetical protein